MPEDVLEPPVECCGREFRLKRALACHVRSHVSCTLCDFSGCRAALDVHLHQEHGHVLPARSGKRPASSGVAGACSSEYKRRDGSSFDVIDEPEPDLPSLEERFPGASICWAGARGVRSVVQEDEEEEEEECTPAGGPIEVPDNCRIVLLLGPTASGKSRLLRALRRAHSHAGGGSAMGDSAGAERGSGEAVPIWPADISVIDCFGGGSDGLGVGREGQRWLSAAGVGSVPLWCQPHHSLSAGEASRATLARALQVCARRALSARELMPRRLVAVPPSILLFMCF